MTIPNARPFDLAKQEIDDLFDEAKVWLETDKIESDAEAAEVEKLLALMRDALNRSEEARKDEVRPIDAQRKEVQERYRPLSTRAEIVVNGARKLLTGWRDLLAKKQAEAAAEVRRAAEEASQKAQHVAEVAGSSVELQEIIANTEDTARRLLKNAERAEAKVGTGLRMRTVYTVEIDDPKLTIAWFWRTYPDELTTWLNQRLTAKAYKTNELPFEVPGARIIAKKEAY